ncbi:hypothetical protein L6452_00045 [Arctium lappa]|uniref:Uncharacterized protein n=1 Tax=Arctium lappa TaxID=4217 RepID=A0ACB9FCW9_ARCLA|nr:hypothetical protein L6452_00045 [Arctium lappa]
MLQLTCFEKNSYSPTLFRRLLLSSLSASFPSAPSQPFTTVLMLQPNNLATKGSCKALKTPVENMDAQVETVEARLQSFLGQLQSELGVLDRIVQKNKNQHRRSSYFQYLLKVRRDCKLLQSTNLEEIVKSSFLAINGNRPKQKVHFLESSKRRKCDGGKQNFLVRLQGAARLLSEMVEPMLKAAMYPSF